MAQNNISLTGQNFGKFEIAGNKYFIKAANGQCIIEGNLKQVESAYMAGKKAFGVKFSSQFKDGYDNLCEMKFSCPQNESAPENKDSMNAQELVATIESCLDKFGNNTESVGNIAMIPEIEIIFPKLKADVSFQKSNLLFKSSTSLFKIVYQNIQQTFILPVNEQESLFYFVIKLNKQIVINTKKFKFVVMQLGLNEVNVNVQLSEEQIKMEYQDKVKRSYQDSQYAVFSNLFKHLVGINMVVPGQEFLNLAGCLSVNCMIKSQKGHLYPMHKSLLYLPNPACHIKLDKIGAAKFSLPYSAIQSFQVFDLEIKIKEDQDEDKETVYLFQGINIKYRQPLIDYFKIKKVEIQQANKQNPYGTTQSSKENENGDADGEDMDEDDDDESFNAENDVRSESSQDGDFDSESDNDK